jgi:hypothetical protein
MMKKIKIIGLLLCIIAIIGCNNDDNSNDSLTISNTTISINTDSEITYTSIMIDGKVTSEETDTIINRGVCWSIFPNPTIDDNIILENTNEFSSIIEELTVDTTYYFKTFVTNQTGTIYSEEREINTLSLHNTSWRFTTVYENNFEIYSRVDLYDDYSTKFDELDIPGQCPGCFITMGTWSVNENILTYIWEGSDPSISTYIYTGTISGMDISGNYIHTSEPNRNFTAMMM